MRAILGFALPCCITALLRRSSNTLAQDPSIACGKGQEKLTAYQTAYLEAYYKTASAKLFQADGAVSDEFRKLDLNGNGVLDCSELGLITKDLDVTGDLSKHSVGMLRSESDISKVEKQDVATSKQESMQDMAARHAKEMAAQQFIARNEQQIVQESSAQQQVMTESTVYQVPVAPVAADCTPQCTWTCATKKCDQVCSPKCQAPQCQTRCSGMSTAGCQMECGKPRCAVVCPPTPCAAKNCPICTTKCSKPMCKLVCPAGTQDCRDVCENPACEWKCGKPELCPAPACAMQCDPPKACRDSTYKELPALGAGESIVQSFETPLSLLSHVSGGKKLVVPVSVTTAVEVAGSSDLKLVHSTIRVPIK